MFGDPVFLESCPIASESLMEHDPESQIDPRLVALNELHRSFWERESKLFSRRFENPAPRQFALDLTAGERARGIPIYFQMTLESATHSAVAVREIFVTAAQKSFPSELGKRGGRRKRSDALQVVIEEIVAAAPTIGSNELLKMLHKRAAIRDVIEDIDDGEIFFVENGRQRSARLAGVKDRLTRARKKLAQSG
jgi:hypothetical protein